ncbi:four helix bundle protein [Candidatus Berkelbacteria bacterium]|nr:four helix bundle protein [Candidatus Berkelbacteria bacterium]
MQNEKEKFKKNFIRRVISFSVAIIKFVDKVRSNRSLWPVADQLVRSATSIGANIVEAKASSSKRDYTHFFQIALKSANETKYWLIIIKEISPELQERINPLLQEADELSKIVASSILTLKGKK